VGKAVLHPEGEEARHLQAGAAYLVVDIVHRIIGVDQGRVDPVGFSPEEILFFLPQGSHGVTIPQKTLLLQRVFLRICSFS
jgi:hypothetical protein